MNDTVGYWFEFLIAGCLGGFLCFLSSVVGSRKRRSLAIPFTSIFLGWTLIGWFAVVAWAMRKDAPRMRKLLSFLGIAFFSSFGSFAQGTFQNLNFEAAFQSFPPDSAAGKYSVATVLPNWDVYFGTNQQSQMGYNLISPGQTWATLVGPNGQLGFASISGRYSVVLQGGVTSPDASIRQSGTLPASTAAILFQAEGGFGPLLVSLNGQNIPISAVSNGPNFTLFGGDVSAFAGQMAELRFSAPAGYNANNDWTLDSIMFSATPVPEPASWIIFLVCGCGIVVTKRARPLVFWLSSSLAEKD